MAPATGSSGPELALRQGWLGFDLITAGPQVPRTHQRGELFLISGSMTAEQATQHKAGWDITIANVDPRCCPDRNVFFLAPTMLSRYEAIEQCGTSTRLDSHGRLCMHFKKSPPVVLHLSGLCFSCSREEPLPLPLTEDRSLFGGDDWDAPALRLVHGAAGSTLVLLQGCLRQATYGATAQTVAQLPQGHRPRRELRCLASLLAEEAENLTQSVAVTLKPCGAVVVQGGRALATDSRGRLRSLQEKKRGRLCFDGIRFALREGQPLRPAEHLRKVRAAGDKLSYLMEEASTAVVVRHGDLVMLEGHLTWADGKATEARRPLATLPAGCRPACREVFFTRGGSDLEERRRVDVDVHGRIFCPEGAKDGRLELTGVIFLAAEREAPAPASMLDELEVQRCAADVVCSAFGGKEALEEFARRCSYLEWLWLKDELQIDVGHRKWSMRLPGTDGRDSWEEGPWGRYKKALGGKGVGSFEALMQLSDGFFEKVCTDVAMPFRDFALLRERRRCEGRQRPTASLGQLRDLASRIVDEMFEHWDFEAQVLAALANDERPPQSIRHLFNERPGAQEAMIRRRVRREEMPRFEEARQFFKRHETTGCNMTHSSFMGCRDLFSSTGKWHFPDDEEVQRRLFQHAAWLFERGIMLYMSERQTARFPFIEDLDIQCRTDWQGPLAPGETGTPPDELLMSRPRREAGGVKGDPGELMKKRAEAIHVVYPDIKCLEVLVYSASGFNKGKEMLKSSFHLVWPQLLVDADHATVIRDKTLALFERESARPGSFLSGLKQRLLALHESNEWALVFDKTTINAQNGLRLPYSDKASLQLSSEEKQRVARGEVSKSQAFKSLVREGRPTKAVGRIRFTFGAWQGGEVLQEAFWDMDAASQPIEKWIEMGSCRREASRVELTPMPGWLHFKPLEQVRRCTLTTRAFKERFKSSCKQLWWPGRDGLVGGWVLTTAKDAVWRGAAVMQFSGTAPSTSWAAGKRCIRRPAEVVYSKGKVLVDGLPEVVRLILDALEGFTEPDDVLVTPVYAAAS